MKQAVLYARVSTPRQAEEGFGKDYQLRETRRWAETEGYEVIEEIIEPGYSRESLKRPGIDRLRELAEGGFRGDVLAWRRDRYSSNVGFRQSLDTEMQVYGIRLRALDDTGNYIGDVVLDAVAYEERKKTTERTRAGKRERAHAGRYVWSGCPPYGYVYDSVAGELVPDPKTAPLVERIFRIVGEQGQGMNQVCKAFMAEGIPSPRGSQIWRVSTVSRIIANDIYISRSYSEVSELVSANVADGLDLRLDGSCAVVYFNQRRSEEVYTLEGKKRSVTFNHPDDWIAVPVRDLSIPPEWIHAARRNIAGRSAWRPNRHREWPLRGIAFCSCGRQLIAYYNVRKGHKNIYMVCPTKRNSAEEDCPHAKYHRAEPLEERVSAFVSDLITNPEVLREQVQAEAERYEKEEGGSKRRTHDLLRQLADAEKERDRYNRLYARGKLTDGEYDAYDDELQRRKITAEAELEMLRDARRHVEDLRSLVDEYLEWLPEDFEAPVYKQPSADTTPKRLRDKVYTLTPETATPRSEREKDTDATSRKHRAFYDRLGLKALVHEDATLELTWAGGCTQLQPSG